MHNLLAILSVSWVLLSFLRLTSILWIEWSEKVESVLTVAIYCQFLLMETLCKVCASYCRKLEIKINYLKFQILILFSFSLSSNRSIINWKYRNFFHFSAFNVYFSRFLKIIGFSQFLGNYSSKMFGDSRKWRNWN